MIDTKLRPLPGVGTPQQSVRLQSQAGQRQYQTVSDPNGGTTAALLAGLAQLNPRLQQLSDQAMARAGEEARDQGRAAGASMDLSGVTAASLPARIAQADAPMAFGDAYRDALSSAVSERFAIKAKQDMVAAYNDRRMEDGFDGEAFAQQWWNTQYTGLKDPRMVAAVSRHHEEALSAIRQDQERLRNKRLDDLAVTSTQQMLQDRIKGPMTAREIFDTYRQEVLPQVSSLGRFTKAEAAGLLLQRVASLSDSLGGAPEMFKALEDFKDEDGYTIASRNPQLSSALVSAKNHAEQQRQRTFDQSVEDDRGRARRGYDERLMSNPAGISDEEVLSDSFTFPNYRERVAFLQERDRAASRFKDLTVYDNAAEAGILGTFPAEVQRDTMNRKTAGEVEALRQIIAAANSDPEAAKVLPGAAATVAQKLLYVHRLAGSTTPSDPVKGMMAAAVMNPVKPGQPPSAAFLASAELYRNMDQQFREAYVPSDEHRQIYDTYIDATQMIDGAEPAAAAAAAFDSISPEARRRVKELRESPEFKDKFSDIGNKIAGTNAWVLLPRVVEKWAGMIPSNSDIVALEARRNAETFLMRNPAASVDQAVAYAERKALTEWVMDPTSSVAVKVPPQVPAEQFSKALGHFTEQESKKNRFDSRNDGKWTAVPHVTNPATGEYILMAHRDGMPVSPIRLLKADEILQGYRSDTMLNEQDRAALAGVQQYLTQGVPVPPEVLQAADAAIAKGRATGTLSGDALRRLEKQAERARQDAVNKTFSMPADQPNTTNLIDQRPVKVDRQATSRQVESFLRHGGWMGMAGALVSQGEAVALTAYPDPNPAAGLNIGAGYNLSANAKTVNDDLRRAGVPKERIEDVKAGRASISPDQAEALTKVALPRYAKQAHDAVTKASPGLWERMTDGQRAVLVDIAWQTGNPGQFQKAIKALADGDAETFRAESRVYYTNKAGQRVEDTRRNNLRAHILAGTFPQAVGLTKNLPATPVDILASN